MESGCERPPRTPIEVPPTNDFDESSIHAFFANQLRNVQFDLALLRNNLRTAAEDDSLHGWASMVAGVWERFRSKWPTNRNYHRSKLDLERWNRSPSLSTSCSITYFWDFDGQNSDRAFQSSQHDDGKYERRRRQVRATIIFIEGRVGETRSMDEMRATLDPSLEILHEIRGIAVETRDGVRRIESTTGRIEAKIDDGQTDQRKILKMLEFLCDEKIRSKRRRTDEYECSPMSPRFDVEMEQEQQRQPSKRRRPFEKEGGDVWSLCAFVKRAFDGIDPSLLSTEKSGVEAAESLTTDACATLTSYFRNVWTNGGAESEFAFEGLLVLLERSLSQTHPNYDLFSSMIESLGESSAVEFLRSATPYLIECDARNTTDYVELLVLYISVRSAKTGPHLIAQYVASSPDFIDSFLKTNLRKFTESFVFEKVLERRVVNVHGSTMVVVFPRSLAWYYFTSKRIVVANAPPVKLARKPVKSNVIYDCAQAGGGLVSGVMPCMRAEDLWVDCMDDGVAKADLADAVTAQLQRGPNVMKATLSDGGKDADEPGQPLWNQFEADLQPVQRVFEQFAERQFVVNPSIVMKQEHKPFDEGISNGLLWPAFHDLMQYIIDEYKIGDDGRTKNNQLDDDWITYIKINYYFALHSARKNRPQDFLWVHDYHLFLVGSIMRSMMPDVRCGYFLHIPYLLPTKFFDMYNEQGMAILRGLLGFSRVGFQTQRDVDNFLKHVQKYLPEATVADGRGMGDNRKSYTITYDGATVDVGAFAIGIDSKQLLSWCQEEESKRGADELRRRLLDGKPDGSRLFVSVERFDYTKGILERLRAFQTYLRRTNRKDVYYQIAASSRTGISSYMEYQDRVVKLADEINSEFGHLIHMDTENHPQKEVVPYYMAADAIMVTPAADGMNLVVKEAAMCNPKAVIILSTGAGAENQFSVAGLTESYLRVADIHDTEAFADVIEKAATMDPSEIEKMGKSMFEFVKEHDIQRWLDSYLDPSWCHDVAMVQKLSSIREFQDLMMQARDNRRRIVRRVLKHQPFDDAAVISLENIEKSLNRMADDDLDGYGDTITLDGIGMNIYDEMDLLKKDCRFIDFYRSDGDIDHFIDFLASSHPRSNKEFMAEMDAVLKMLNHELSDGIDIFLTDWDGTMTTYAHNYRRSMQPAYSAIVMSLFANRYTKLALVVADELLRDFGILDCTTIPYEEGYLTVGGSLGREWLIDGKRVADETALTIEGAAALDQLSEAIRGLLATDLEFSKFIVVGSGFQRKLDRITVGVQSITCKVDERLSKRYADAILKQLERVDPERRIFEVVNLDLELEMVLKTQGDAQEQHHHWTKSDGIRFVLKECGVEMAKGNVLICGDTISDVPMVETASQLNPDHTYAIFVNPSQDVKNKLASLLDEKHHVIVGCPEVIHAAMAKQVLRPLFVVGESPPPSPQSPTRMQFVNFQDQLATMGLMLRDIPGDGNCLFRALNDQMEGHSRDHLEYRRDTVRFMEVNRDDFEPFVEDDVPLKKHVDQLSKPGVYGGHGALVAFARMKKVNIVIHQLNMPLWQIEGGTNGQLHLSYHNRIHYSSVRTIGDSREEPANIKINLASDAVAGTSASSTGGESNHGKKRFDLDEVYDETPNSDDDPRLQSMSRGEPNHGGGGEKPKTAPAKKRTNKQRKEQNKSERKQQQRKSERLNRQGKRDDGEKEDRAVASNNDGDRNGATVVEASIGCVRI